MKYTNAQIEEILSGLFYNSAEKAKMMMLKRGFSEADAEDAVQDAFEKMTKQMQDNTDSDMNEAYFITSVKNAGTDLKRSVYSKRTVKGDDLHEDTNMEQTNLGSKILIDDENGEGINFDVVMQIINTKIKPKHKEAIELVYFRGYSAHEIERVFGINHNSILGRLRHAYSAIRMFYNLYMGTSYTKKDSSELQKHIRVSRAYKAKNKREANIRHYGSDKHYNT